MTTLTVGCDDAPAWFSGTLGAWLVTRHQDLRAVAEDPETYSSHGTVPAAWATPPEVTQVFENARCTPAGSTLVGIDDPEHAPLRRALAHALGPRRLRPARAVLRARADELIDTFVADGSADLLVQFAEPFARSVIGTLFGLSEHEVDLVHDWTDDQVLLWNPLTPVADKIEAAHRMVAYEQHVGALIEQRRSHPRDDVLSDLVNGVGTDLAPMGEADVQRVFRGLRVAGLDTLRDALTSSVLGLLGDRDWDAPHRSLLRVTTREARLGGVHLPAGTPVLLLGPGRDQVASAEHTAVRTAIQALTCRIPGLALRPGWRPTYTAGYFSRGPSDLRVVWPIAS